MANDDRTLTDEQIGHLEEALAKHQDDATVRAVSLRLEQCQTAEQKRDLIRHDLLPLLAAQDAIKPWEGREVPSRLVLRDILQDFLYREGFADNLPTNEGDMPEEQAEREHLSRVFATDEPLSSSVIDDRGPH